MTAASSEAHPSHTPDRQALTPHPRLLHLASLVTAVLFAAAALYYIAFSLHWRIMIDSAAMHYVVFLMRHGRAPYTQISDNNMPGAYFVEALGMAVFGPGDLGWRLYEYVLLAILTAAMIAVSPRKLWAAGLFSAVIFISLHSAEGPQYASERELIITVILLLCMLLLFAAVRKSKPWLLFLVGLGGGLAASIKPTYLPFTLLFLLLLSIVLHRHSVSPSPYLLCGCAGFAVVALACLGFLLHFHALGAFDFILARVLPTYAGLAPPPWNAMLQALLPRSLMALTLLTVPVALANRKRLGPWSWHDAALAAATLLGLASFLLQRKGFFHHRYVFLAFLFLLVGAELFKALEAPGWPRYLAAALLLYVFLGFAPRMLRSASQLPGETQFVRTLGTDLNTLGGPANLQDKVQCFDLVYGCLNVLYHQGIEENTGFTGDLLFFSPRPSLARTFYREWFWNQAHRDPASVLIVSNATLLKTNSYDKLNFWPEFNAYLDANYILTAQRDFPYERFTLPQRTPDNTDEDSYRIYLRKGSPLLSRVPALSTTSPAR